MFKKLRVYAGDTHPHLAQTKTSSSEVITRES